MATASAGRAARGCREAPARSARPCSTTASRFPGRAGAKPITRAKQPAPALKSEEADMNSHFRNRRTEDRSRTYRAIPRGAAPPLFSRNSAKTGQQRNRNQSPTRKAIATIPPPARQPEPRPSETPFQYQTPAREALQAVSTRTCVPIADILGRNRRPPIAAARHEAVWRVRQATGWSLPRLGRFFKRDHTTVLHSLRKMEKRSACDPELLATMTSLSLPQIAAGPTPINLLPFPVRAIVCEPGKRRRQARLPLAPVAPTRGCRGAPARSARPCSATASRSAGRAGAK